MAKAERTIEDRLREEYFDLLPAIRRVAQQLEAEIRYHLLCAEYSIGSLTALSREMLAFKYHGYCKANRTVRGEYQIVSMLTGSFWEVEHSAMYKPDPRLRGVARHVEMNRCRKDVLHALRAFEEEFEDLLPAR